jgi:hypothetical protein
MNQTAPHQRANLHYEVEVPYNYYILNITLTNKGLDSVVQPLMTEEQKGILPDLSGKPWQSFYLFVRTSWPVNVAGGWHQL